MLPIKVESLLPKICGPAFSVHQTPPLCFRAPAPIRAGRPGPARANCVPAGPQRGRPQSLPVGAARRRRAMATRAPSPSAGGPEAQAELQSLAVGVAQRDFKGSFGRVLERRPRLRALLADLGVLHYAGAARAPPVWGESAWFEGGDSPKRYRARRSTKGCRPLAASAPPSPLRGALKQRLEAGGPRRSPTCERAATNAFPFGERNRGIHRRRELF